MSVLIREIVEEAVVENGERTALLAVDGRQVTYEDLLRQLDHTAQQLRALGIGRQDRVAIVLPNGLEMALAFLSVAAAAAAAPMNPAYRRAEYAFYLADLQPKAVIVLPDTQPELRLLAAEIGLPLLELKPDLSDANVTITFSGETAQAAASDGLPRADDTALILHTSGTTSRPKMVPLSQANIAISAANIVTTLGLRAADRCLNVMPHFHIHGLMAGLMAPMRGGSSVVCTPRFDAVKFYAWMDEYHPTYYTAVPTMHQAILERSDSCSDTIDRSALRFIRSSSASLPPVVMADLQATFGCPVIESYGMTEAAHQMASNPMPPAPQKAGTVGLAAGPEVAIMEEDGSRLLPVGETGEIVIRGANVTGGYLENPQANEDAFTEGWFRTGDQGVFDADGYLSITGRLKEIINRGGEKIAPREIDEVLLSYEGVVQAVAFAIPDQRLGEEVGAAVILAAGADVSQHDLQQYVAKRLADFKVPRRILFVDAIPKGATGKLQRVGLAAQFGLEDGLDPSRIPPPAKNADPEIIDFVRGQWMGILHLDAPPADKTFLDMGGDSVQAMRLVSRINELIGIDLTIVDLFNAPTIAHQALIVEEKLLAGQWNDATS